MSADTALARLLPDWPEFERDYVNAGVPHTYLVSAAPYVAVYADQGAARLGARFAIDGADPAPGSVLNEVDVSIISVAGARQLEVSTTTRNLYPNFFGLVAEVVGEVIWSQADPCAALAGAITRWESLLSHRSLLSVERQAGLFGELWLLERLAQTSPIEAVEAWTGPAGQAHDFRLDDNELEVKTTSGAKRVHMINGVGQLEPSPGCALFLLSLQLADGGAGGSTLPQAVERIDGLLAGTPSTAAKFKRLIESLGYTADDASFYPRRYRLRSDAKLVAIGPGTPHLTREALLGLPRRYAPQRFGRITYEIDVEGLGFADASPEFDAIIPPPDRTK